MTFRDQRPARGLRAMAQGISECEGKAPRPPAGEPVDNWWSAYSEQEPHTLSIDKRVHDGRVSRSSITPSTSNRPQKRTI
jgi:hypothetical protein